MKIHHVAISVCDLEKSLNFYKDVFGFKEISSFERYDLKAKAKFIQLGDFQIELWEFEDCVPAKDDSVNLSIIGIRYLAFEVNDIESTFTDIKSRGIEISQPKQGKTGKYCFIQDPDGIKLEFCQPNS